MPVTPRDIKILLAIDAIPLTVHQLLRLANASGFAYSGEDNLRRRLRSLRSRRLVSSWPLMTAGDGRSPNYFKLTREGYRHLRGPNAGLPNRRYFEAVRPAHHHHTFSLAEVLVRLSVAAHRHGHQIEQFARENSVCLKAGEFQVYPDAAFVLRRNDGRTFSFCLELDNSTERVRSKQDVESIERKLRAYDAHQSRFSAHDPERYLVVFITTRSKRRCDNILLAANSVMQQPHRTVFIGTDLKTLETHDPFADAIFQDHRGLKRMLIPVAAKS